MAIRGIKPKPPAVKALMRGTTPSGTDGGSCMRVGPLTPPALLTEAERVLWTQFVDTAWWLTQHDAPKAYVWCVLQSQFQADPQMIAAKIANLRAVGSELGFDPSARARMDTVQSEQPDPTDGFFQ